MRTPAQALKDAIKSGAVEAFGRSEKIQVDNGDGWEDWKPTQEDCAPAFHLHGTAWRPAPTKRRIPFTFETAPADAWWRTKSDHYSNYRAIKISESGILFPDRDGYATGYDVIAKEWEVSADRLNWKPGSQEVES